MNKIKQWSLDEAHYGHKYETIKYGDQHNNFYTWLSSGIFNDKISILDIGGGNGNVVIPIISHISRYLCLDINQKNVELGSLYFKSQKNVEFKHFDVDEDEFDNEKFNVSYIDSVFHMVDDPWKLLSNLILKSDCIYLNRTFCKEKLEKKSYQWGGMNSPSTLWQFDLDFFNNFQNFYNCEIFNGNGYFIISNPKSNFSSIKINDKIEYLEKYKKELKKDISKCSIFT